MSIYLCRINDQLEKLIVNQELYIIYQVLLRVESI